MVHIFSPLTGRSRRFRTAVSTLALATVMATLAGCASVPPPDGSMNLAQSQLQAARDAGAADYAPVDLGFAQNKFQQAQSAMASRKYDVAGELADEARADAELARAKARLAAARAQIQQKSDDNEHLRQQIEQAHAHDNDPPPPVAAPASASSNGLPPAQPMEDLPAPPSSQLSSPQDQGQGTQTLPDQTLPDPNHQGGQL